jgi:hypothetical protein
MCSNSRRANQLNKLIEFFDPIECSIQLPLRDLCSRAEFYDESPELLTSVCSMYYLSRLLMHASMVPILSGRPVESPAAGERVKKKVEMVLQQAIAFVELLQQLVSKDLDMTRLWPFSGYAAFVAGSVFVVHSSRCKGYTHLSASALCKPGKCYSSGISRWESRSESTKQIVVFAKSVLLSLPFHSRSC